MGGYESREFDRLKARKFRPYSIGHQRMYTKAIDELRGSKRAIFEAGFGIGWGLGEMLKAGIVGRYLGCEPNADSFIYTSGLYGKAAGVVLHPDSFTPDYAAGRVGEGYDVAFCIEVIEHVPMCDHLEFLRGLRNLAPVLYFSTPDKIRVPAEGVRTVDDWRRLLAEAGFTDVRVDTSQWTYLYRAR